MELHQFRKWLGGERPWGLWIVLLVAFAVAIAACQSAAEDTADPSTPEIEESNTTANTVEAELPEGQPFTVGFTPDGHAFKGDPDASIIIEEYSSYQCPFCARYFSETYPELTSRYIEQGDVLYIFKDFPLSGQPQSPKAAEAARCAGEVDGAGAFWDMHDRLFAGQREWSGQSNAEEIFKGFAGELGLDQAAFDECLDNGIMAEKVDADTREGMTRGVRGTPSFFINDQLFVGAQPISAFAAAIDRAVAGEPVSPPEGDQPTAGDTVVPTPVAFDLENDEALFALGDPNAPVTMVEFSDYQCPVCARHFDLTWPALKEQYVDTGRVYYVFKDLPLTSIHPQAFKAHEAARCAYELGGDGAFWDMHDRLFGAQAEWSGSSEHETLFDGFADDVGLETDAFSACLESGRHSAAVQADMEEAFELGVNGTPTFFIGGYPFSGAHPIQNFDQIITLAENGQLRDAITEAIAAQAEQQQQQQQRPTMAPAVVPVSGAPAKGDPNAPVTIVEYSDYQCPFCSRHFEETLPQLLENYIKTGQVRYVFKDFPLTSIHPQAVKAAEAARCAREVGGDEAYWQMHDQLFAEQGQWSGNPEHLSVFKGYAGDLELDQGAFDTCLNSGRYEAAVAADLQEGAGFGVSGTPAFYINGQPVGGAQPYQVFEQMIEGLLAEQ